MSKRKIKRKNAQGEKNMKKREVSPMQALKVQQALRRDKERAMDNEAIRRYIHNKEFDVEHRYDAVYCAQWARKANMKPSRFNKALDCVIKEAWRKIRNGEQNSDTDTAVRVDIGKAGKAGKADETDASDTGKARG